MQKNYQMPLQLFLILEKSNPIVFTTETCVPNHYLVYMNKNNFFLATAILKNEFFSSKSSLIESTAIDSLNYNSISAETNISNITRILPFYLFYLYSTKIRLTIILNNSNNSSIESIDKLYKNASWLEREAAEMYGIYYKNKKDCRKLLLDYTKDENPMLKDFPTEGTNDIFYNFFEDQVNFDCNNTVEL